MGERNVVPVYADPGGPPCPQASGALLWARTLHSILYDLPYLLIESRLNYYEQ